MSLAADGQDGNGLQLEKLRPNFSSCFRVIDINDCGLLSFCELRLHLPLDVQRKCSERIKLATATFQDSLGKNIGEIT